MRLEHLRPVRYGLKRHRGQEKSHRGESGRAMHWMGSKNAPGGRKKQKGLSKQKPCGIRALQLLPELPEMNQR